MASLKRVKLKGFRSIKDAEIELRPLNVLIGANGAGKSNLVAFFKMLNEMMAGRLQQFIATTGRAQSNLHFGPKVTPQMEATLEFEVEQGLNVYRLSLSHAAGDALVFSEESLSFVAEGPTGGPRQVGAGRGHPETMIDEMANTGQPLAKAFRELLLRCRVFHFHDTSSTAGVRQPHYVGDNRWLMPDAANLAAMLHRWREENRLVYDRIVRTVTQIAPFFADFDLRPEAGNGRQLALNWLHKRSDSVFGPHQLSDGTLRAICLIALFQQPEAELPSLIVVDEPELGLHPYALNVVASIMKAASLHTQVLISTQSSTFLDNFEPADVVVVKEDGGASNFSRLDEGALKAWLEEYSLGEIWEKNVIDGGPH